MSVLPIREEAIRLINEFNEEELRRVVELLKTIHQPALGEDYDEANDPMLNGELIFEGAEDLSERVEDILREEWQQSAKRDENTE